MAPSSGIAPYRSELTQMIVPGADLTVRVEVGADEVDVGVDEED
jgi:hypothetical protein